jgi:hypothetical protein
LVLMLVLRNEQQAAVSLMGRTRRCVEQTQLGFSRSNPPFCQFSVAGYQFDAKEAPLQAATYNARCSRAGEWVQYQASLRSACPNARFDQTFWKDGEMSLATLS